MSEVRSEVRTSTTTKWILQTSMDGRYWNSQWTWTSKPSSGQIEFNAKYYRRLYPYGRILKVEEATTTTETPEEGQSWGS